MDSPDYPRIESEAQQWIEEMTGCSFPSTFADSLKDGVILCKLANVIKPGSVPKFNNPATMPFRKMENITSFIKVARSTGMRENELFGTPDLYDEKNIYQVVSAIHALGRHLQTIMPDSAFPKLGVKVVEKNERQWTEEQLIKARAAVSILNLGCSDMGRKAAEDLLVGKAAMAEVLEVKDKTPHTTLKYPGDASSSGGGSLPAGWSECRTPDGQVYYYNATTNVTQWDRPGAAPPPPPPRAAALPYGWEELRTEQNEVYYYHAASNTTQWDKPTA